ncbi:hypothetical protein V8F20_001487 [Naviculisporaceae sp. PSN 640]
MSQHSIEVQRLEAECRRKREETRILEARLKQAKQAQSSISAASGSLDPALVNYPVPASHASLASHARSRSNTIPRGATAAGVPVHVGLKVEHGHSPAQEQSRPMKKSKTTHHATAPSSSGKMPRSASNTSSMPPTRAMPFAASRPVAVSSLAPSSYSESERLQVYLKEEQYNQPANVFLQAESFYPQTLGREFAVDEYLSMIGDEDTTGLSATAPMPIPAPASTLLSPESAQFSVNSAIPSACGSMTSGPTIETAPMTRSNSNMNDNSSISGQFAEMVRIRSDRSYAHQDSSGHSQLMQQPSLLGKRSMGEADFMAMGSNLADLSYAYGSSAPSDPSLHEHQHAMVKSNSQDSTSSSSSAGLGAGDEFNSQALSQHLSMERSVSNTSIRSNRSLGHRAKEALYRQNANASRNLKPKPASDMSKKDAADANPNKGKDGKAVITKAKYERPKHPKVKCNQCNENPEGFRGDHELRRHTEAKHRSTVKKWICRDPAEAMIPHTEKAIKPLKDCKQCSQQKQYGAYYNAAAHLRRTHFKVKPARKSSAGSKNGSKGQQASSRVDDEKRGGKGGGDWPSMAELKLWMVEISVNINQIKGALDRDDVDSVGAPEQDEMDGELGEAMTYCNQASLGVGLGQDTYGMATAYAGGGFPQNFDGDISYQTLQGDLGSHPELYIDTSSYVAASLQDMPISSSSFDFNPSSSHPTQHHMASSMMSIDSHSYTSPVSSTATITQGGVYGDHLIATQSMHRDDFDMSFDMAFAVTNP